MDLKYRKLAIIDLDVILSRVELLNSHLDAYGLSVKVTQGNVLVELENAINSVTFSDGADIELRKWASRISSDLEAKIIQLEHDSPLDQLENIFSVFTSEGQLEEKEMREMVDYINLTLDYEDVRRMVHELYDMYNRTNHWRNSLDTYRRFLKDIKSIRKEISGIVARLEATLTKFMTDRVCNVEVKKNRAEIFISESLYKEFFFALQHTPSIAEEILSDFMPLNNYVVEN